jgi:hypothetical protein
MIERPEFQNHCWMEPKLAGRHPSVQNRRSVLSVVEESWPMFTLKHEGNILFFETNQSPPGADSEIV